MLTRQQMYDMVVGEHFQIADDETREVLLSIDEDDQAQVLLSLTSKLYESITDKVDDIDFGEIPDSKGDITKIPNYDKIVDCLDTMEQLIENMKQDPAPVRTVQNAIENIKARKGMFEKAYKMNLEFPILTYNTICLSIVSATSYLISTTIDFIKTPGEGTFEISLNKVALKRSSGHLLFTDLEKFNKSCETGELDKAMEFIISKNVKNLTGTTTFLAVTGIIAVILTIIPIIRELIFLFYYMRTRVSEYFDAQADLLLMNAQNIQISTVHNASEKKHIIAKQAAIANSFKKIANAIAVKGKNAETSANAEISNSKKKYKIDDVVDQRPDSASSSLF